MLAGSLTLELLEGWEPPVPFSRMVLSATSLDFFILSSSGRVLVTQPVRANMFFTSSLLAVPPIRSGGAAVTYVSSPRLAVSRLFAVTRSSM